VGDFADFVDQRDTRSPSARQSQGRKTPDRALHERFCQEGERQVQADQVADRWIEALTKAPVSASRAARSGRVASP
jgi:hypothetical protein